MEKWFEEEEEGTTKRGKKERRGEERRKKRSEEVEVERLYLVFSPLSLLPSATLFRSLLPPKLPF